MAPCAGSNDEDLKTVASAIYHFFRFECESEINETYEIVLKNKIDLVKPKNKFSIYCEYLATKVPGFITWDKFLQFMQIFHIWLEFDKQCDDIASGKGLKTLGEQNGFRSENGVISHSEEKVKSRGKSVYHELPTGPQEVNTRLYPHFPDLKGLLSNASTRHLVFWFAILNFFKLF